MKRIISIIVVALLFIGVFVLVIQMLSVAIKKSDNMKCQKLLSQSQEYPLFYLTANEKAMCDYLGVTIEAPVR